LYSLRCEAVKALVHLAPNNDEDTLCLLRAQLMDSDSEVRCAVVEALGEIASPDDRCTRKLLEDRLSCGDFTERCSVLQTISLLAAKDDAHAIHLAASYCDDNVHSVRCAAIAALATLGESNDAHILNLVSAKLQDSDPDVRSSALRAMSLLMKDQGDQLEEQLPRCLAERHAYARCLAKSTFHQILAGAEDELSSCNESEDGDSYAVLLQEDSDRDFGMPDGDAEPNSDDLPITIIEK